METKTISFDVVRATDLTPFTLDGKRHMHFHYFQLTDTGWLFLWIDDDTNVEWLKEKISEGRIYILP